jgi:hypothetical protein
MSAHVQPVAHRPSTDIESLFGRAVDNSLRLWITRLRGVDCAPDTRRCQANRISGAHP